MSTREAIFLACKTNVKYDGKVIRSLLSWICFAAAAATSALDCDSRFGCSNECTPAACTLALVHSCSFYISAALFVLFALYLLKSYVFSNLIAGYVISQLHKYSNIKRKERDREKRIITNDRLVKICQTFRDTCFGAKSILWKLFGQGINLKSLLFYGTCVCDSYLRTLARANGRVGKRTNELHIYKKVRNAIASTLNNRY